MGTVERKQCMNVKAFWEAVLRQDAAAIRGFFHPDAWVNWHCTNEHFTLDEYIRANCEYPGQWDGEIEQMVCASDHIITATHVYTRDRSLAFHVVSFLRIRDGKIAAMDEYWGDDAQAPQWRQDMQIGRKIR